MSKPISNHFESVTFADKRKVLSLVADSTRSPASPPSDSPAFVITWSREKEVELSHAKSQILSMFNGDLSAEDAELARAKLSILLEERSDREIWEDIQMYIGIIEKTYLTGGYQNSLAKITAFLNAFNSEVYSNYASWVRENPDGKDNELIFDGATACKALNDFLGKYGSTKEIYLYGVVPVTGMNAAGILWPTTEQFTGRTLPEFEEWTASLGTADKSEAIKWASDLGVPESCVVAVVPEQIQQTWVIKIDVQHVQNMRDGLVKNGWTTDGKTISNLAYQAYNTSFTSSFSSLKAFIESLTERSRNAKATFDNLSNVLSGTITACTETAKQFLI